MNLQRSYKKLLNFSFVAFPGNFVFPVGKKTTKACKGLFGSTS